MSEGDSPHGALSDSESNNSIIHKVRSRVSSIIPNSLSKWFSPSTRNDGDKNGSSRRRRELSEEQDSSNEDSYNQEENGSEPPVKRTKCDDGQEQRSTSLLHDQITPSTSRMHQSNSSTRFEETRPTATAVSNRKLSTPSTSQLLNRNRRYLGLNKTVSSTPYDFSAKSLSAELANFEARHHTNNTNNMDNNNTTSHQYSRGLDVRKRMKLESVSGRSSTNNNNYESTALHSSVSGMYSQNDKTFNNNNLEEELAGSDILGDDDDEDEVDELTLPIEEGTRKYNGIHDTPSESEGSICSFTERPSSTADILHLNDDERKSIHQNRLGLKSGKTGINFSSHLQTEKSLFSDKNLSSGLTNSSMSLNSWNRRPSFNASLYGSTSALSDSRLLNIKSPFYDGQTIYGGASAYAKNISRMQKALRVPVQIRPVSSLSTSSSSNTSNNNPVLSNTAKRILDIMNQFNVSSPLNDAKKMGNTLSSKVPPPLSLARHNNIVEDELNLNRSIRLNSAKSPYARPDNKTMRPVNKSLTTELQIPSVSQLLQIKRLQNRTEELRQLANESKSILNTNKATTATTTEYKLPANDNKDSDILNNNNSNKHTNKIKNKISQTRPDKKQSNDDIPVNLPNISFPAMKSVPQFDITLPGTKSTDSFKSSENSTLKNSTAKHNANVTSKLGNTTPSDTLRSDNFKFSFTASNVQQPISPPVSNSVHKKTNGEFSFSAPIKVSNNLTGFAAAKPMDIDFEFRKPIPITKCNSSNDSSKRENILSSSSSVKKVITQSTVPTFNFSENLDKTPKLSSSNPMTFSVPKPKESQPKVVVNNEIPKPIGELKSGSVMDVLMKFRNEKINTNVVTNEKNTTVTAEPVKEIKTTEGKSLNDMFKPKTGTWECDACMVRNDGNLTKCLACETPKPGSDTKPSSNVNNAASSLSNPFKSPAVQTKNDESFKKLVEKQNEKWECSTCMTRNESTRNKCICCEQAKPGASVSETKFSFGSVEPKFSFGIPPALAGASAPAISTVSSIVASATAPPTFTFGVQSAAPVASATSSFTFGTGTNTSVPITSSVASAIAPSGDFTFGTLKPADKVDSAKNVNTDDKKHEENKSKTITTSIFGSSTSSTANSIVSNTPPKVAATLMPTESKISVDTTKKNETQPTGFIFGIQSVSKTPESNSLVKSTFTENPSTTATTISSPSVGGFKFTPPNNTNMINSSPVASNTEKKLINPPSYGATIPPAGEVQQTSTFGQTSSGFSLFKKPEISSPLNTVETSLAKNADPKPALPTFGSITQTIKIESTSAPQTSTETKLVATPFVFGSTTNATPAKTENIFGSSTINPAPPVTTASSGFGNSTGFGFPATTTNSTISSPFSGFGGGNSATPTVGFGTKSIQSPTPTFGSFGGGGGGNTTISQQTTTNNNTNTTTPVFGSFGAAADTASSLNSNNNINNTPTFGQPSKLFGANSGTTEISGSVGFGNATSNIFGQNTASATFGSQVNTASQNFGGAPATTTTALPGFGTSASTFNTSASQNDTGPPAKAVFQFGGNQQTNEPSQPTSNLFTFGAANNSNNNAPKPPFNFSTTTPPSFNFTATAPSTNSVQPFTFGGAEQPQQPVASGGFNFGAAPTEVASNAPFQFGAAATHNPFAATPPAGPPRRKVRPARRIR